MTSRITTYIHSKLELILGTASGVGTLALDIELTLIKAVLAVVFGFLGAAGAWVFKKLVTKATK